MGQGIQRKWSQSLELGVRTAGIQSHGTVEASSPELLTRAYHAAVHLAERTDLAGLSSSDMLPSSKRWRFWCLSVEQFLHHGFT
jgi:hypothetical protein